MNNSVFLYTFRTNPHKDKLKEKFPGLFIFGKLNEDFVRLSKKIIQDNPDLIIGLAKSNKSCFESRTINRFNNGNIIKNGKEEFNLFMPPSKLFSVSIKPTTSFCNWTMYKISNLIEKNKLSSKFIFIHYREKDYNNLVGLIEK